MSFLRLAIVKNCGAIRNSLAPLSGTLNISSINVNRFVIPAISNSTRSLSLTVPKYCDANATDEPEVEKKKSHRYDKPNRDRSKIIPVETSIEYLTSDAYKETYGERKIYDGYRRVHKGSIAPRKTRESCIRFNVVTTSSPCPICRDEYLVLDHKNLDLIKQFISPHSGEVEPYLKTGLCRKAHRNLLVAIERAYDLGTIPYEVPFRQYDYKIYYNFDH